MLMQHREKNEIVAAEQMSCCYSIDMHCKTQLVLHK
uniref:Uncharacterized protein n=1 Tax=Arundo donax TaxID=35708 RepID=A0A0A8ZVB8_ARUDO